MSAWRARHDADDSERGSMLIEAMIFMVVIGISLASYTTSDLTIQRVQRSATASDIASQQAQGVLEAAKSLPWAQLGFASSQTGLVSNPSNVLLTGGSLPGPTGTATDDLFPVKTIDRGNATIEQTTTIVWVACATAPCGPLTPASTHGTKRVSVRITYTPKGGVSKTRNYTMQRSSQPSEALPVNLAARVDAPGVGGGSTAPTAPSCVEVTFGPYTGTTRTMSWQPVPGALSYKVYERSGYETVPGVENTTKNVAATSHVVGDLGGLPTDWYLSVVTAGGESTFECQDGGFVPTTCVQVTYGAWNSGRTSRLLNWSPVPGATGYKLYRTPSNPWKLPGPGDYVMTYAAATTGILAPPATTGSFYGLYIGAIHPTNAENFDCQDGGDLPPPTTCPVLSIATDPGNSSNWRVTWTGYVPFANHWRWSVVGGTAGGSNPFTSSFTSIPKAANSGKQFWMRPGNYDGLYNDSCARLAIP